MLTILILLVLGGVGYWYYKNNTAKVTAVVDTVETDVAAAGSKVESEVKSSDK